MRRSPHTRLRPTAPLTALASALVVLAAGLLAGGPATASPARASAPASAGAAAGTEVTKLLVVVMENHSIGQMRAGMPYTASLAERYGYATDYRAVRHPSLPNYLAVAGGATHGVTDDQRPSRHRLGGHTVFGQAVARGRTAVTYAESMPRRCALRNSGRYAVRHNPWTYFTAERASCRRFDRKLSALPAAAAAGRLPRVGLVVPNTCHDAHDCSLATADAWFERLMGTVLAGPDWRSGRLAVVLTADEDDHDDGNRVLTVVVHPSQSHHVVGTRLTHYSLTRLYDEVADLPLLRGAASAPSMVRAFGLPVR